MTNVCFSKQRSMIPTILAYGLGLREGEKIEERLPSVYGSYYNADSYGRTLAQIFWKISQWALFITHSIKCIQSRVTDRNISLSTQEVAFELAKRNHRYLSQVYILQHVWIGRYQNITADKIMDKSIII